MSLQDCCTVALQLRLLKNYQPELHMHILLWKLTNLRDDFNHSHGKLKCPQFSKTTVNLKMSEVF